MHGQSGSFNPHNILVNIIGGVTVLGITLILGSYGYTWGELKAEQDEKHQWRKEHQEVLDKRFDEIKEGQKELQHGQDNLEDLVNRNQDNTKDILKEILEEQKKITDKSIDKSKEVK